MLIDVFVESNTFMLVVYTKEYVGDEGDEPSPRRGHVFDLLV